jgi:hypothetical protein
MLVIKESDHWLNPTPTHNRYSALLEDESEYQQQTTDQPPSIYRSDVTTIPPLIQLLEQIAELQYKVKALAGNQVKTQPKTSECYRTIAKALAENRTAFHTYKTKEE